MFNPSKYRQVFCLHFFFLWKRRVTVSTTVGPALSIRDQDGCCKKRNKKCKQKRTKGKAHVPRVSCLERMRKRWGWLVGWILIIIISVSFPIIVLPHVDLSRLWANRLNPPSFDLFCRNNPRSRIMKAVYAYLKLICLFYFSRDQYVWLSCCWRCPTHEKRGK